LALESKSAKHLKSKGFFSNAGPLGERR
jgi:hypothetical protein